MLKKLSCMLLCVVMLCCGVFTAYAQPVGPMKSISCSPYYNDNYCHAGAWVSFGQEVTLELRDLKLDGVATDESEFTFTWFKGVQSDANVIEGATSARYTFTAEANTAYICLVQADGAYNTVYDIRINVDTVQNQLVCSNNCESDSDWNDSFFYVYDCVLGKDITFTLNSTSALGDREMTYSWYGFNEYMMPSDEILSTTNTLTFNKASKGYVMLGCTVSDGNYSEDVMIRLMPNDTLKETVKINNVTPERFERGHMAVAAAGEEVKLTVKVETTQDSFSRRWESIVWDGDDMMAGPTVTQLGSDETITVTKQDTGDDDIYGFEQYECYLDDGNEVIQVGIVLFALHPYQVTSKTQVTEGTPAVSLDDTAETLANSLLQENMEALFDEETTAEITLTADKMESLSETEQAAVEAVLPENNEIGACLDLNLYKELNGAPQTEITETSGEIQLSIEVPEEMLADGQTEFTVTRVHEGEAENLNCEYNEQTGKVTFKTDKFSTYVLSVNGGTAGASGSSSGSAHNSNPYQKSPATSDTCMPVALFVAATLCLGITLKKTVFSK